MIWVIKCVNSYSEDSDHQTQRKWPMRLCVACVITRYIFSLLQWAGWLMWVHTIVQLPRT